MLDMLAAIARKDYEDRRRRQAQGIAQGQRQRGRYRGRPEDTKRNAAIIEMLRKGMSWNAIIEASGSSSRGKEIVSCHALEAGEEGERRRMI